MALTLTTELAAHYLEPSLPPARRRKEWLRTTLRRSQQEAVASSTMTATGDNFFNAFAISLNASSAQMGLLTAIPQLFGAAFQLLSVWMGNYLPRRPLVVFAAICQSLVVLAISLLAIMQGSHAVTVLIGLAVLYFAFLNLIQPQWRAWMGSIVPQRRRGIFFAARTRLTMIASLLVFIAGGALLTLCENYGAVWLGFALLFGIAAIGRALSSWLLWCMHDPDPHLSTLHQPEDSKRIGYSLGQLRQSLQDPAFRHYSLFVAGMQGVVAISAPFFAVYMLRDLQFTYFEYCINSIASIATQFIMLNFWGRFSDNFGNRLVMLISSSIIPIVPLLWMLSPNYFYLLGVQMVSGVVWSGFSLSTANYLYDIRPHKTDFTIYAAIQSGLSACAVFIGALLGGWIASHAATLLTTSAFELPLRSPLFLVFITTAVLRITVAAWFAPRCVEPRVRRRPKLLQIILRVSRFNAISGVSLDWMSVTKKKLDK